MRLDKFLALNGLGSRSDVKKIIKNKDIKVNDLIVISPKHQLDLDNDRVTFKNQILNYKKNVYFLLNKPAGYICSHEEAIYPSVLELLNESRTDLIMVGRLDVDTEGLLLITNDGQFLHKVAHGKKEVYKQYYLELEKDFNPDFIKDLEAGLVMDGTPLKPAKVEIVKNNALLLSIAEGKYHQVKRMMHACDNEVTYLKRVKIGKLQLDPNLKPGHYRELTKEEIALFI